MAKRRTEETSLPASPTKRCRALCDVQVENMAVDGGVKPPSLLALLGSRCRKRHFYFEEPEQQQISTPRYYKSIRCDPVRKHPANMSSVQTLGSFQDIRSVTVPQMKTRPGDESGRVETMTAKSTDKADEDVMTEEDCAYNSFQFWRTPLPELDLSLLEDDKHKSHIKNSSEDMET